MVPLESLSLFLVVYSNLPHGSEESGRKICEFFTVDLHVERGIMNFYSVSNFAHDYRITVQTMVPRIYWNRL